MVQDRVQAPRTRGTDVELLTDTIDMSAGGIVHRVRLLQDRPREAGNCEMTLASRIHALPDEGWTVALVDLHEPPYCDGAAIAGSFAACFIPAPP
jgi:hypothetical protein